MPPIEIGTTRAVGAVDVRIARAAGAASGQPRQAAKPAPGATGAVMRSDALDPGQPPVDAERVAVIRQAIRDDAYPVIPMRAADAMIAAGLLLRSGK